MAKYSDFLGKVREGRVVSPTRRDFDPDAWTAARTAFAASPDDDALHAAGLWFHSALAARWECIVALGFPALTPAFAYQMIALVANKNELAISTLLDTTRSTSKDAAPFNAVTALRLGDDLATAATADMRRTSMIDTLGKAVTAVGSAYRADQPAFAVPEMLEALKNFEDIYLLEFLWGRVLWLGWTLESSGTQHRFFTPEPDQAGRATVIADWRREQVAAEFAATFALEWMAPRSVPSPSWEVRARAVPGGFAFRVQQRPPGHGRLSPTSVTLEILGDGELGPYLDRPLPLIAGDDLLCLRDIVEGWELLSLAAEDAEKLLERAPKQSTAGRLSLALPLNSLVEILQHLGWTRRKCLAVIDFLTFTGKSQDGVWTKPLLKFGTKRLLLLTPLVNCNLGRIAGLWAAEGAGEIFFAERGTEFEPRLRAGLATSVANRPWGAQAMVVEAEWAPRIDKVARDIDLVFRIGSTVFVGEIKLKRYPNSAAEVGRNLREFEKAAGQLDLRLAYLRGHLDEVAKRTRYGGSDGELRVMGFILTGTAFGAGMTIGGYPVVDRDALDFFFSNDTFLTHATVSRSNGYEGRAAGPGLSIELVDEDPAICLLGYLRHPLHVRHAEQGLRRSERHNQLKASSESLSWPENYIDPAPLDAKAAREMTALLTSMKHEAQRQARVNFGLGEP